MGGLSSHTLTRINTDDARGCSHSKPTKGEGCQRARSSSASRVGQDDSRAAARSWSMSPFHFRCSRPRETSPNVGALTQSDAESDTRSTQCGTYISDNKSQGDAYSDNGSDFEEEYPNNGQFDPITEANTEANASFGSCTSAKEGGGERGACSWVYTRITHLFLHSKPTIMTSYTEVNPTLNEGEAHVFETSENHLLMPCGNKLSGCLALGRG